MGSKSKVSFGKARLGRLQVTAFCAAQHVSKSKLCAHSGKKSATYDQHSHVQKKQTWLCQFHDPISPPGQLDNNLSSADARLAEQILNKVFLVDCTNIS